MGSWPTAWIWARAAFLVVERLQLIRLRRFAFGHLLKLHDLMHSVIEINYLGEIEMFRDVGESPCSTGALQRELNQARERRQQEERDAARAQREMLEKGSPSRGGSASLTF